MTGAQRPVTSVHLFSTRLDVCRRIRTWSDAPIVVLSADGSEDRKVDALDQGADGYMTKPFGMRELNARLKVALRHHIPPADSQPQELDVGALRLDLVHYEASLRGRSLDLTPREFDFLAYLARNAGKVCARRMILEHVWGPGYVNELHYLKVYAYRIRRKLGDDHGDLLQSDPAVGYRLALPGGADGSAAGLSVAVNRAGGEGGHADREVFGAVGSGGAVTHPFPRARMDRLAGLDGHLAAVGFHDQGPAQHDGEFVELRALPGLGPASGAAHVRDAQAVVAGVGPPDVLVDQLRRLASRGHPARFWDQLRHSRQYLAGHDVRLSRGPYA